MILPLVERSIATSECQGESLESLRNRLLFSPAAPPSFVRNLVRKLDVPRSAATCAQVRERMNGIAPRKKERGGGCRGAAAATS